MKAWTIMLVSLALMVSTGCDKFERAAFNTLATSKAVTDLAQADYENGSIPRTQCAYSIINDAKSAQATGVTGLLAYHNVAQANGNTTATAAALVTDLSALAPLIVKVQSLISNPVTACGGGN